MPILDSELDRIRAELGYNLLNVGAEPYIGVQAIFTNVIQRYCREGLDTYTSTPIGEAGYVTLALNEVDNTLTMMTRVAIDVDGLFEMVTVRAVDYANKTISVYAKKTHYGTYPVTVDGGLQCIRECLAALADIREQMLATRGHGALKQVDEVGFYDVRGNSQLEVLQGQAEYWRDMLAKHCGIPRIRIGGGGSGSVLC